MQTVPDEHKREDAGILRVAMNLRNGHNISYFKVCLIIKEKGLMIFPPQMSNPEDRIGYATSRIIPIPCGMDCHVIKYTHFRDLNLITYLEDTTRCVTGA